MPWIKRIRDYNELKGIETFYGMYLNWKRAYDEQGHLDLKETKFLLSQLRQYPAVFREPIEEIERALEIYSKPKPHFLLLFSPVFA